MVKKITGPTAPLGQAPGVQSSTEVKPSEIHGVQNVSGAAGASATARARKPTRPMTAAERDMLFRLINEEADKLFSSDQIPASKRETIEGAVRMALDGALIEEEEEDKSS